MSHKHAIVITIVDESNRYSLENDVTNKLMKDRKKHAIPVVSCAHMIHAVLHRLKGRLIKGMLIWGHGAPGIQGVGANRHPTADITGFQSLRTDANGELVGDGKLLARLRGHLTRDAIIVLSGCKVARGDVGERLLLSLSNALGGIGVEGGTDNQKPYHPGCEGVCMHAADGIVYPIPSEMSARLWNS